MATGLQTREREPTTITIPAVALPELFYQAAAEFPEQPAIIFSGNSISYRRLRRLILKAAAGLARLGFGKGDRLGIILPNCPQVVVLYYAALHLGGVVVMINPLAAPREIRDQLQRVGARLVVVLDNLAPRLEALKSEISLDRVIVASLTEALPFPQSWLYGWRARRQGQQVGARPELGQLSFPQLLARSETEAPPLAATHHDIALLQYTGGTTGTPKAAILTHRNLVANVMQINAWLPHCRRGGEKVLAVLPYFHVFGMTAAMNWPLNLGGTIILFPRFEALQVLRAIHKWRPTVFPAVPTMYTALLQEPQLRKYDLSSLWGCISGSAPLPRRVQEEFERLTGGRILEGYGLTETSPVTHLNPVSGLRKPGSIGLPLPGTECRLVDPETGSREVGTGEVGELLLRGPQVMAGYWEDPAETALALRDGWLYTGDLAKKDSDGFYYLVGRKKDLIIASGFNVYPREVEEVLHQHPAVAQAVVFGVPEDYRGETVMAVIVPKAETPVSPQELFAFCRQNLAAYKVPRIIEFRQELPKTAVGKVLRQQLRDEAISRLAQEGFPAAR